MLVQMVKNLKQVDAMTLLHHSDVETKSTQTEQAEAIYLEVVMGRESVTITCIRQTQRQASRRRKIFS